VGSATRSTRVRTEALLVAVALTGCSVAASPSPSPGSDQLGGQAQPGDRFLLPGAHLAALRAKVKDGAPEWTKLERAVEAEWRAPERSRSGAENFALAYLLTGNQRYARAAWAKAKTIVTEHTGTGGRFEARNWYEVGDYLRPVALTYDWCQPALTEGERSELLDFMARAIERVWFDNGQGGWQLDDPGGNFHMAYLEATAFGGYALQAAGRPEAARFLRILEEKITRPGGVLDYLDKGDARGGDFYEGANYGQRSKQRLFLALSLIASRGGPNYFTRSRFFEDALRFAVYQAQPGKRVHYPTGNMARTGRQDVSPLDRYYAQIAVYHLADGPARRLGQWYLERVAPSYDSPFALPSAYWVDVIYRLALPAESPAKLPLSYLSPGTGLVFMRSSWDDDATSLSVNGFRSVNYSHQSAAVGGLGLWKGDWLVIETQGSSDSHCGGGQARSQNAVVAARADHQYVGEQPGMGLRLFEDGGRWAYVQVDATRTNAIRPERRTTLLLDEWTRDVAFLRPDVVVLYDRVDARPGNEYHQRFHFPGPNVERTGDLVGFRFGGGALSLLPLTGSALAIRPERDDEGAGCPGQRLEVAATGKVTRFLTVLRAALGKPPSLAARQVGSTNRQVEGAQIYKDVVLFSARPGGAAPDLPFTYVVPDAGTHRHLIAGMKSAVDILVTRSGEGVTVTVSRGTTHPPTAAGLVEFGD